MKARYLLLPAMLIALSGAAFALEGGVRQLPARDVAVPSADVSPAMQALIGAPLSPI